MRLLIVTQAVDTENQALGFFVDWIAALAKRFETITVICLTEGAHELPENVTVHSLGKEKGRRSKLAYAIRFKWLAWKLRGEYDAAFVHMNQEYILIAGPLWKLLGKPAYLWRNHYDGSWLTDIAALFCTKVFCTSAHSYTARFKKTMLMPVGVDTARFHLDPSVEHKPRSILFLARIAPSKRPDLFIEALGLLLAEGISFVASVYGSPLAVDTAYYESLKARAETLGLHDRVRFYPGVANAKAPAIYGTHEIFVNCSRSGMLDKTIYEAAASGCLVLAASEDIAATIGDAFSFTDAESLAARLRTFLTVESSPESRQELQALAERNSLSALMDTLAHEIAPRGGSMPS